MKTNEINKKLKERKKGWKKEGKKEVKDLGVEKCPKKTNGNVKLSVKVDSNFIPFVS